MTNRIIVTDYLTALRYIVDGYKVVRKGDDFSGVYWEVYLN